MRQETVEEQSSVVRINLPIKHIEPLTENQAKTFQAYEAGKNLMLHGSPGTGKSFISLYLALSELLSGKSDYERVVIIRSVVPTREMGFLPGTAVEKAAVYEAPYHAICADMFGRGDAYETLKKKGLIEFESTSFLRGTTFNNCIVIVDEMASVSGHELDTIVTRVGKNCRIIFCGDYKQSDFTKTQERNGLLLFMKIIHSIHEFEFIEFTSADIVRSGLVRRYLIAKEELHIEL
jgi:phosphate starvation-inducible PhoH-like protein